MVDVLHAKTFEPHKRLCAGRFQWVSHRFPIKGGISLIDVLRAGFLGANTFISTLPGEDIVTFRGIPIHLTDRILS